MNETKIQCPECSGMLFLDGFGNWFKCTICKRLFKESEIRERCGL